MKKIVSLLLLLIFSTSFSQGKESLAGADWDEMFFNDEITFYINKKSIRREKNHAKLWDMQSYIEQQKNPFGDSYRSVKRLIEFNCKKETSKTLAFTYYSSWAGRGDIVRNINLSDKEISESHIIPGTIEEVFMKIPCGKK
jgi:hypothetical protein